MSRILSSCMGLLAILFLGCGDGGTSATGGSGGTTGSGGAAPTTSATGGEGGSGGVAEPFRIALSVSPFTGVLFNAGAEYTDGALTATDAESLTALYVAHGANELFARISTEKAKTAASDDHSLETALARAALAKKLGLPFNPELGLWEHYGDIGCEPGPDFSEFPEITLPGPWYTLTIDQMTPALHDYAAAVAAEILATGVTVDSWDIGNEIDLGVAGVAPEGFNCATLQIPPDAVDPEIGNKTVLGLLTEPEPDRIAWLTAHVWPHEAKLLAAVADGIRSVDPKARVATHISQSLTKTFALAFYQAMADGGFTVDRIGFSYYPTATAGPGRAQKFKDTILAVQEHFGKPAYIAEVAYLADVNSTGAYASWTHLIPRYPMSDEGQGAFFRELTSWSVASGVAGIRPWGPEIDVAGWEGFALFDSKGGFPVPARKAISTIAEGASAPDPATFLDE